MKNKSHIIISVVFFVLINTTYFWEGQLGFFLLFFYFLLFLVYIGICYTFIKHSIVSIKEKFTNKNRLYVLGFLLFVIISTAIKPQGLINYTYFESPAILIAKRVGVANCGTILKLKDDKTFTNREVCFGITEIKGTYHIKKDTIYFDPSDLNLNRNTFFRCGVLKPISTQNGIKEYELILYKKNITKGFYMGVTTIEIDRLKLCGK